VREGYRERRGKERRSRGGENGGRGKRTFERSHSYRFTTTPLIATMTSLGHRPTTDSHDRRALAEGKGRILSATYTANQNSALHNLGSGS